MAGSPLKRARKEQREAEQLATFETTKRQPLPEPHNQPASFSLDLIPELLALASEGYALTEIAAHWSISEETLEEWRKTHSAFGEALNHARAREKAWWLSRARLAIRNDNNKFPAGAWSHVMRARFPEYADHNGVTVQLNVADLVVIQRREPEPLQERTASAASPLIEHRTVRLEHSLTVDQTADPRVEGNLSDADDSASTTTMQATQGGAGG